MSLVSLAALSSVSGFVKGTPGIGIKPQLVFDFANENYFTGLRRSTFDAAMTHTRSGNATMVDSDGVLKWAPHNLWRILKL